MVAQQAVIGATDRVYRVGNIVPIVRALQDEDVPLAKALHGMGVSAAELGSPETKISLAQILRCYQNAVKLSADPYFSYHAGQRYHLSTLGIYGLAILCCTDLRSAAQFVRDYRQLGPPDIAIDLHVTGSDAVWTIEPVTHRHLDPDLHRFIVELHWGILTSCHRDVLGASFRPRELRVTYAPIARARTPLEIFGCPSLYHQKTNQYVFDASWLDRHAELGDEATQRELLSICEQLLAEMHLHAGLPGRIRGVVLQDISHPVTIERVSRKLNMAPRSLRRRLAEQHTSFRRVLGELKAELAVKYLRETELTQDAIASLLGYADASSLRSSLRRWTGKRIGDYRPKRAAS